MSWVTYRHTRHLVLTLFFDRFLEPTVVPPVLLDLCTVAILHRFSSPSWWEHLSRHVSADVSADDAFDKVVSLQVRLVSIVMACYFADKTYPASDWRSHRPCALGLGNSYGTCSWCAHYAEIRPVRSPLSIDEDAETHYCRWWVVDLYS